MFSRARHERFRDSDALRRVFEGVVSMCIAAGLVGGEAFSVDASLIKADVGHAMYLSRGDPLVFIERPISAVLLLMSLVLLMILVLPAVKRKREEVFQE